MPSSRFFNNAAHSNGNTGLAVNRRLGEGHTIIGCSTYTPLVDPKDKRSEYQPIFFDTFHGKEIQRTADEMSKWRNSSDESCVEERD